MGLVLLTAILGFAVQEPGKQGNIIPRFGDFTDHHVWKIYENIYKKNEITLGKTRLGFRALHADSPIPQLTSPCQSVDRQRFCGLGVPAKGIA